MARRRLASFRRTIFARGVAPPLLAVLLVGVPVVRLLWGWHVNRQIEAHLTSLRRAGHPVSLADLPRHDPPDAANAAAYYARAARAYVGADGWPDWVTLDRAYPPYPPKWVRAMAEVDAKRRDAFALVRQARPFTAARFSPHTGPADDPGLGGPRLPYELAYLQHGLLHTALHRHHAGDDAEAVERIRDLLHLSRSLRQDPFRHYAIYAALAADHPATLATFVITPGLRPDARVPATRDQLRALIRELLDTDGVIPAFRRAAAVDRAAAIDAYQGRKDAGVWLLRPLHDVALLRYLRMDAAETASVAPPPAPVFAPGPPKHEPPYTHWFASNHRNHAPLLPWVARAVVERHMAAASVACHLYRLDHGRYPDRLDALVPAYLPAVPSDPFLPTPGPIGYVFVTPDRPMVHDHFGPPGPVPADPQYTYRDNPQVPSRQHRDVTRFLPPGPSSPQVRQDDPPVPDRPRDDAQPDDAGK